MERVNLNDVDMRRIKALVKGMKEDPEKRREMANSVWKTRLQWVGGFESVAFARELRPATLDEPDWLAGANRGFSPHEITLSALGASIATVFVANASALGVRLDSLELEVEGNLDLPVIFGLADGNPGYSNIGVKVFVESDAPPEVLQEIYQRAVSLSPVANTIRRPVNVTASLHYIE